MATKPKFEIRLSPELSTAFVKHRNKRRLKSEQLFREMFESYLLKREIIEREGIE